MKVYLHQFQISFDPQENLRQIQEGFTVAKGADLLVVPEACTTGFQYKQLTELAAANRGLLESISQMCRDSGCAFMGSLFWKENSHIYNRAFFIDQKGEISAHYDKIRLIPAFREDKYLSSGQESVVFDFNGWKVGLAICYDLRFPEIFREMALKEAELVLICAEWPASRVEHMITLARARAIENQCCLVLVNAAGLTGKIEMAGRSMAVSPRGEVLLDLGGSSSGGYVEFSKKELQSYRDEFPALYQFTRSCARDHE